MTILQPQTFGALDLQAGGLEAHFGADEAVLRSGTGLTFVRPHGHHPRAVDDQPSEQTIALHIRFTSWTDVDDLVDQVDTTLGSFDLGTTAALVVAFDAAGSDLRSVQGTVTRIVPYNTGATLLTVVLTVADMRWRGATVVTASLTPTLTLSGTVITDALRAAGVIGDGRQNDHSLGIWNEADNECGNGNFELPTGEDLFASWVVGTTNNRAEVTEDEALFGSKSLKLTYINNNVLASDSIVVSASGTYVFAGFLKIPSSYSGGDITPSVTRFTGATLLKTKNALASVTDQWQIWYAILSGIDHTTDPVGLLALVALSAPTPGDVVRLDGVHYEQVTASAPQYVVSSPPRETKAAGRVKMPASLIDETTGWISVRYRLGIDTGVASSGQRTAWAWGDDNDNVLEVYFDRADDKWRLRRRSAAAGPGVTSAAKTYAFEDVVTLTAEWDATDLRLKIDTDAILTNANTAIPTLVATIAEIGSDETGVSKIKSSLLWLACGTGTLTQTAVTGDYDLLANADDDLTGVTLSGGATETFRFDGTGEDPAVTTFQTTNAGNVPDDEAEFEITPTAYKLATDDDRYRRWITIANVVNRPFNFKPVDITDGGWDHAAEVTAVRSRSDGNDVRVYVDGRQVDRWFGEDAGVNDADSTALQIWINLTQAPRKKADIRTAMTAVDPAVGATLEVDVGDLAGWEGGPGALKIENEIVLYSDVNEDGYVVSERGARGTTAAIHAVNVDVFWVEHDVQLVYGDTNATAPTVDPLRKPTINLEDSTNVAWHYTSGGAGESFYRERRTQSAEWVVAFDPSRDTQAEFMTTLNEPLTAIRGIVFDYLHDGGRPGSNRSNIAYLDIPAGLDKDASPAMTFERALDADLALQLYAVGNNGEELLLDEDLGAIASATESVSVSIPAAGKITRLLFYARSQIIARATSSNSYADFSFAIDTDADTVQFSVGEATRQPATANGVGLLVELDGAGDGNMVLQAKIRVPDGAGGFKDAAFTNNTAFNLSVSPGFAWIQIPLASSMELVPGVEYGLQVTRVSATDSAPNVSWRGYRQPSPGDPQLQYGYKIEGTRHAFVSPAVAEDEASMEITEATVNLDADGVHAIIFGGQQNVYHNRAIVTNNTSGQSFTLDLLQDINETITVRNGERDVTNDDTGEILTDRVTWSDKRDGVEIDPGVNTIDFADAGAPGASVTVQVTHDDVYA